MKTFPQMSAWRWAVLGVLYVLSTYLHCVWRGDGLFVGAFATFAAFWTMGDPTIENGVERRDQIDTGCAVMLIWAGIWFLAVTFPYKVLSSRGFID